MSSYGQYTKHYFANDRRVSSRVGGGLPQGADAPHTTQLPSGRSWYDRSVAMKEQMERAFECADMTEDRLEFATSWGVESLIGANNDAEVFFYHQNHQGSPVFVSTASGYLTEQQLLQAYGEVFASAQNAASWRSPYSFTGKEFDAESGLHYFGARYYLSSLGVWLSTDPLADQFANVSPYAYAANNPALFTDRWGLAPDPPAWWKAIVSGVREIFGGSDISSKTSSTKPTYAGGMGPMIEVSAKRIPLIKKITRAIADDLRNMPTIGVHPNYFFGADAIFADLGVNFIGSEFDAGFFFVLNGANKGELHFYWEGAGGVAPDASVGAEIGRVDVIGASSEFELNLLYGDREKYWLTYSPYPYVGIGGAISYSQPNDGMKVIGTSFQGSVGTPFPFSLTGGYNAGKISK